MTIDNRITLAVSFILMVCLSYCSASTIFVPDHYSSIQEAINAAANGDEIIVRDGEYREGDSEGLRFLGKSIHVKSENGPENCIVNCENQRRGFTFLEDDVDDAVLDGFKVINGSGKGAGIYCYQADVVILNCIVTACTSDRRAGGIYIEDGYIKLRDCQILDNMAEREGGGLFIDAIQVELTNCQISDNTSLHQGGGLWIDTYAAWISNCQIVNNDSSREGGGIYSSSDGDWMVNCQIVGNTSAGDGGGMYSDTWWDERLVIANTIFSENECSGSGGGIRIRKGKLWNCLIDRNIAGEYGGGVNINHYPELIFCTIAANHATSGAGLAINEYSTPIISNSIIWANSPDSLYENEGSNPEISFCTIPGGYPGNGNIDQDPLFFSGESGEYYLSNREAGQNQSSPCINIGSHVPELECIDLPWGDTFCLNDFSTRTDHVPDLLRSDLGFHYTASSNPQTPTPTPTPEPSQSCESAGVQLIMPANNYSAGDICFLSTSVCNPGESWLYSHALFISLELNGQFWLAPAWCLLSEELSYYSVDLQPGDTLLTIIEPFYWPNLPGSVIGMRFWGALLDPEMTEVVGGIHMWEFSYSDM